MREKLETNLSLSLEREKPQDNQKIEEPRVKHLRLRGIDIFWTPSKEISKGRIEYTGQETPKRIYLRGRKSAELAWALAHELAHALEPKEKKVKERHSQQLEDLSRRRGEEAQIKWQDTVPVEDVKSGRHFRGEHFYPPMTSDEFQASRRVLHYLELACSVLGLSVDRVERTKMPRELRDLLLWSPMPSGTHHRDRGYYYQWEAREKARKALSRKQRHRAGVKLKERRAAVRIKDELRQYQGLSRVSEGS